MTTFWKSAALAAVTCMAAPAAYAVTVTPFATPLSAGDNTFGNATAVAFEDFNMTSLSFTAADMLSANISATINPFLADLSGTATNSIDLSYGINGGAIVGLPISVVDVGVGSVGAAGTQLSLDAGDTVSIFVSGSAGRSGNQVTFAIETSPAAIPVPAAGLMLLTALGGAAALRRKKTV